MIHYTCRIVVFLYVLALSSIVFPSPSSTTTLYALRVEAAAEEVYEAVDAAYAILDGLHGETLQSLSADFDLLVHSISHSLERLEDQRPLVVDRAVIHDLHFVADVVRSISIELETLEASAQIDVDAELSGRLDDLSLAANTRLNQVDRLIDQWIERKKGYLVQAESDGGNVVVRYSNRLTLDAVRYIGVTLFLIGLLVVAIIPRINRHDQSVYGTPGYKTPFLSKLTMAIYFCACLALAILPGLLVGLSAEIEVLTQEHSCDSLQAQRDRLELAQELDNKPLIDFTKERMQTVAGDCLDVEEAAATAAVEHLAIKTASARVAEVAYPTLEPAAIAPRNAQVTAERVAPKVPSAIPTRDRFDPDAPENLDQISDSDGSPEQPVTAPALPTSTASTLFPVATSLTSGQAPQEIEREASLEALATSLSQDRGVPRTGRTAPQSVELKPRSETAPPAEVPELRAKLELYLHFTNSDDRSSIEELGDMLGNEGYKIAGIELVEGATTTGDIRYRHQDQGLEIENIRIISETYLNQGLSSRQISLRIVDIGRRYPAQPRNRIELWLPTLKK